MIKRSVDWLANSLSSSAFLTKVMKSQNLMKKSTKRSVKRRCNCVVMCERKGVNGTAALRKKGEQNR